MPPTITEDRNSSSIASDEHIMEKRRRGGIYEFRPGLTALDFHHAVAQRASCDTTCVALAVAATSLATIQEHEVQPGAIPEPGLLQVDLFSNRSSRRPIGSRNRCGVHNSISSRTRFGQKAPKFRRDRPGGCKSQATSLSFAGAAGSQKGGASPRWSRSDRRVRPDEELPCPRWR